MAQRNALIYDTKERYMRLYIKPPRRQRFQVQKDVIDGLGGYLKVAGICLVQPISVSKWMEDPFDSGQDITVRHLQTCLAAAGEQLTNLPLQHAVDELLQDHFLSLCHRRAYPEDEVFKFVEMLTGKVGNP